MKNLFPVLLVLLVVSCGQKSNKTGDETQSDNAQTENTAPEKIEVAGNAAFDINSIPVSSADIGSFPYLSAPEGYEYSNEHNRKYEEKYFFYNDSLVTTIGGKYYQARVYPKKGEEFSDIYIVKNYEQAIKKIGGVEIYSGGSVRKLHDLLYEKEMAYAKDMYDPYPYKYKQFVVRTPNGNVWFELCHGLNAEGVDFTVMYEGEMEESIKILKADELKNAIDKDGKAVLYINFDTDKATLKPDGVQAVEEIAKLMEKDSALKLSVEGHTDNMGEVAHNKKLSLDRAQAVVIKLTELGIAANCLKAVGYGADKPLVANDSDDNKAKNRRVEIVSLGSGNRH